MFGRDDENLITECINSWLGLGPIYNPAHQSQQHSPGHPKASDIIFDIDDNPLDPPAITRSVATAPRAGDTQPYGNGKYFDQQSYVWRILTFANVDWARSADIEDDIHRSLRAKGEISSPENPLSFAGKHHALVFLLVTITSPDDRKTSLHVRSDDALRIWLNGEEIAGLRWAGERDINEFSVEARAEVRLSKGGNVLLAAVAETHGEWGFSTRIEDSAGLVMTPTEPGTTTPEPSKQAPMEPLFRLALIRPAVAQDPANRSIRTAQESPFQRALADASTVEQPREALQQIARNFVAGAEFIGNPGDNPLSAQLTTLSKALDQLERQEAVSHADVVMAIEQAFGSDPGSLVQNQTLDGPMAQLRDSLLAIKQLQEEHGRPIEALTNQLRDLDLIVKVAQDCTDCAPTFPATTAELRRYRRRSLLLPSAVDLPSILSTAKLEEEWRKKLAEAEAERRERAGALFDKYQRLGKAIDELIDLGGDHFQTTLQKQHEGFTPPEELNPIGVLTRQTVYLDKLSDLNLKQLQAALDRGDTVDPLRVQDTAGASSAAALAEKVLTGSPHLLAGSPAFRPMALIQIGFRLKATAAEALSEGTRELLNQRKLVLAERPLDRIVESLQTEIDATGKELGVLYGQSGQQSIKRIGDTLVTISMPVASAWASIAVGTPFLPLPVLLPDKRIPPGGHEGRAEEELHQHPDRSALRPVRCHQHRMEQPPAD